MQPIQKKQKKKKKHFPLSTFKKEQEADSRYCEIFKGNKVSQTCEQSDPNKAHISTWNVGSTTEGAMNKLRMATKLYALGKQPRLLEAGTVHLFRLLRKV